MTEEAYPVYWNYKSDLFKIDCHLFIRRDEAIAFAQGVSTNENVDGCYVLCSNSDKVLSVKENERTLRILFNTILKEE